MLLMVARLGPRAPGMRSMPVPDVGRSARTISITRHKTGVAPGLPPPGDIGWAVIDYLREGRPKAATCPQPLVRQVAPFDAFGATANPTDIPIGRARGAGIRAPRDHKTPRPLRHAPARRLPGQEVPTGDISRTLGHVDRRTHRHLPPHGRRLPVRMRARPGAGRMAFAKITSAHVAERRAVGPRCERDDRVMARIAASRGELGCPEDELPRALVEARAAKRPGESETTRPCRAGQARGLANRMMRAGYDAYVAPGGRGRADRGAYEPHILADAELASPSPAAGAIAGGDPASRRAQAARLPGLPCSSGLRCGEACSLAKGDAAPEAGIPAIRHAKNGKGRLVPPRPPMTHMPRIFHDTAALRHPQYGGHGLFWSLPEGRPTATGLACRFLGKALWAAGISHGGRGRGPRVRDLRLAFACHRLRNWVREGADADAMMPPLAAHVGHADIRRAEYYLRPAAGTCPGMVAQVERECGWVVPS